MRWIYENREAHHECLSENTVNLGAVVTANAARGLLRFEPGPKLRQARHRLFLTRGQSQRGAGRRPRRAAGFCFIERTLFAQGVGALPGLCPFDELQTGVEFAEVGQLQQRGGLKMRFTGRLRKSDEIGCERPNWSLSHPCRARDDIRGRVVGRRGAP